MTSGIFSLLMSVGVSEQLQALMLISVQIGLWQFEALAYNNMTLFGLYSSVEIWPTNHVQNRRGMKSLKT